MKWYKNRQNILLLLVALILLTSGLFTAHENQDNDDAVFVTVRWAQNGKIWNGDQILYPDPRGDPWSQENKSGVKPVEPIIFEETDHKVEINGVMFSFWEDENGYMWFRKASQMYPTHEHQDSKSSPE